MENPVNERILYSYFCDNSILDEFADPYSEDEFDSIDMQIDKDLLMKKINYILDNELTFKERQVICMVFGLFGEEPHSVTDVSAILRVTKSNVYKILKKAISKIRDLLIV